MQQAWCSRAWEGWRVSRRARARGMTQGGAHLSSHVPFRLGGEHGALALPTRAGHGRLGRLSIGGSVTARAAGLPVGVATATAVGRCGVVGGARGARRRRLVAPLEKAAAAVAHGTLEELAAHVSLRLGGDQGALTQAARAGHRWLGRAVVGEVDRGRRGAFESAQLVLLARVDLCTGGAGVRDAGTLRPRGREGPGKPGARAAHGTLAEAVRPSASWLPDDHPPRQRVPAAAARFGGGEWGERGADQGMRTAAPSSSKSSSASS